jgi:crossover junction endodeoxyribonuclease RusA
MIVVALPFPDRRLNPNRSKGVHWAATSNLRKTARTNAYTLARVAALGTPWYDLGCGKAQTVPLAITFIQPDRRHRDRDNLLAACKPSLDGVADALEINDSQFDPVTIRREYGDKPGCVRIEIGAPVNQKPKAA